MSQQNCHVAIALCSLAIGLFAPEALTLPAAERPTNDNAASIEELRNIDEQTLSMTQRIDERIAARLESANVPPANSASDAEFIRRVTLDLTGQNPSAAGVVEFLNDTRESKRIRLVDSLLDSPALNTRLASVWADLLLPAEQSQFFDRNGRRSLERWLQDRFAERQRYDRIVGDLLVAVGDPNDEPTAFFTALQLNPEKLATKTSRVFLGSALDCAQCHDHPFDEYKQTDFWGVAAYFAQLRSSDMSMPVQMGMGGVIDADDGEVTLPDSEQVIEPRPLIAGVDSLLGTGSRRQQLAIWLTSRENDRFAKATVNRFWSLLMGRGLIEPVDDMGAQSYSSHPELIDELAEFFKHQRYDVRQLIAAIASSQAYSRSSVNPAKISSRYFATMLAKPLSEEQLAGCLRQLARATAPPADEIDPWSALASQVGSLRGDTSSFAGGVVQSLVTQHSGQMDSLWDSTSSQMLSAVDAPFLNAGQKIEWLYLATLSRRPSDMEVDQIMATGFDHMDAEQQKLFLSDLLWAIVNSTEFAMTP